MSGFSDYYAKAVANHFFRGDVETTAQDQPTELYISLHVEDPTDSGSSADELEGGSYSRQAISFEEPESNLVNSVSYTYITNSNNIVFPNLPASEVAFIGIWTEKDGGRLMFSDNVYISAATPTSIVFNNGDSLSIPQGYIKVYIQ
jgi:hypothetical protein